MRINYQFNLSASPDPYSDKWHEFCIQIPAHEYPQSLRQIDTPSQSALRESSFKYSEFLYTRMEVRDSILHAREMLIKRITNDIHKSLREAFEANDLVDGYPKDDKPPKST